MPRQIFTADEIMGMALVHMGFCVKRQARRSHNNNWTEFKKHWGISPAVFGVVWDDLCTTDIEQTKLAEKEKGLRGLKFALMAVHFLWTYPQNCQNLASQFGVCDKLASGKNLWKWCSRLAGLSFKVIRWPDEFSDPDGRVFAMTLDGRDHKISEKKHPQYNMDRKYSTKKHGFHAGLKYEVGVAIYYDQIVWLSGFYKGATHDLTMFRNSGLKQKWLQDAPGKYIIADLGYETSAEDEGMLAFPNSNDPLQLKKFKSLSRCRQEDVNGRMSKWKCLQYEFTHTVEKHEICFTAVAVMIQYQFDCGEAYLPKMW